MEERPMRHEMKILISAAEYLALRQRFRAVLAADSYAMEDGGYLIRSLYFDDLNDSAYHDKIAGVRDRKKYRIRIYNGSDTVIKLECKEKFGKFVSKRTALLTRKVCDGIIAGDWSGLYGREEDVCKELLAKSAGEGMHPAVIVDYDREAYCYPVSKVRITFDRNLRAAGFESFDLFQPDLLGMGVFPNGSVILEIKYDTVIPAHVARLLPASIGAPGAWSKYCLCADQLKRVKPV
ncbi:MAG: polyphosphate polymerase domain-containing protein [Oscillospiraceae bacterium]